MSLYCLCVHYYRLVVRLCSSIYLLLQGPDSHCSSLWDLLLWQLLLALLVHTPNVLNAPRSTFYFQMPPRRSVRQKRFSSQVLEALAGSDPPPARRPESRRTNSLLLQCRTGSPGSQPFGLYAWRGGQYPFRSSFAYRVPGSSGSKSDHRGDQAASTTSLWCFCPTV